MSIIMIVINVASLIAQIIIDLHIIRLTQQEVVAGLQVVVVEAILHWVDKALLTLSELSITSLVLIQIGIVFIVVVGTILVQAKTGFTHVLDRLGH